MPIKPRCALNIYINKIKIPNETKPKEKIFIGSNIILDIGTIK